MNIQVDRDVFVEALQAVKPGVGKGSGLLLTDHVLLVAKGKKLTLSATNYDIYVQLSVPCQHTKPGRASLPFQTLYNLLSMTGESVLNLVWQADGHMNITGGGYESNIRGTTGEQFPEAPAQLKAAQVIRVSAEEWKRVARHVVYCTSKEETRPILTGVRVVVEDDQMEMVATDGFRLSQMKGAIISATPGRHEVIIPAHIMHQMNSLVKEDDVLIRYDGAIIEFEVGSVWFRANLITGAYPDFAQVFPKEYASRAIINREVLEQAIRITRVFSESRVVRLEFRETGLTVKAHSTEIGNSSKELQIELFGMEQTISLNIDFVQELLKNTAGEQLVINLTAPDKPCLWNIHASSAFNQLIMPMATPEPKPAATQAPVAVEMEVAPEVEEELVDIPADDLATGEEVQLDSDPDWSDDGLEPEYEDDGLEPELEAEEVEELVAAD